MLTRMYYLRMTFWRFALNWIDFLVVCSSWLELFAAALPISPTFLRLLRLGKMLGLQYVSDLSVSPPEAEQGSLKGRQYVNVRLLRAIRVVRMSAVLESLQLLLNLGWNRYPSPAV